MSGSRKGLHDVSPQLRHAFMEGLRRYARAEGLTLPQVCERWWREDWQAAVKALAAFQVRHAKAEVDVKHGFGAVLQQFSAEYEQDQPPPPEFELPPTQTH
ncbi:MAG: hypothetical protein QNK18_12545 [Gammaproteobacteria bacterium]|nr:hypothetical protein [Gammaproteobacteria bacterium]